MLKPGFDLRFQVCLKLRKSERKLNVARYLARYRVLLRTRALTDLALMTPAKSGIIIQLRPFQPVVACSELLCFV